jgi:hypothetical protein
MNLLSIPHDRQGHKNFHLDIAKKSRKLYFGDKSYNLTASRLTAKLFTKFNRSNNCMP